jgi:Flp pilus assembly protein TadD
MATPFLSSEDYDERAHRLYDDGDYDRALQVLKDGLLLYPHAVELHIGLGYTRLAREEFPWARRAFEEALALEPDHEDAMTGLGEVLLRLGERGTAFALFEKVRRGSGGEDLDLLLSMGRALYREELYQEALECFEEAVASTPGSAEGWAALGYTAHRLGDEGRARQELGRALNLDPQFYDAWAYLGHLNFDRGDWEAALAHFERIPPAELWDNLALCRYLELKRMLAGLETGDPALAPWEARLEELVTLPDAIDELLASIEQQAADSPAAAPVEERVEERVERFERHRVLLPDGRVLAGDWLEIVRQLRDAWGNPQETVAQFMRREAADSSERTGIGIPADDPEAFLRASARAGLLRIEC